MNIQKYLIIIKGEDKTDEIVSYEPDRYYVHIKYKDNAKLYTYVKRDFEFYKALAEKDVQKNKFLYNQSNIYNIIKVIEFEKHYRIFFQDGTSKIVLKSELEISENDGQVDFNSDKFSYFKDISKIVSIKTEEGNSLLTNEYEKINFISSDTALYKYFNPKFELDIPVGNSSNIIFPFGANKSQFDAVTNAMNSQISIIQGPPRHGKDTNYFKYYRKYCKKWKNSSSCV